MVSTMYRSIVAFTVFWLLLLSIMFGGISPASAYPVSLPQLPQKDVSIRTLSAQKQGSPSTPATLLPRSHGNTEPEPTTPENKEVIYSNESSGTDVPSEAQTSDDGDDDEDDDDDKESPSPSGLNPNIVSGVAVGSGFGLLLVIAALMYAFRVGWEKGRKQREKEMAQKSPKPPTPPTPPASEHWKQVDTITPPEVVLGAGSSCWDSASWPCCDDHMEKYKPIGERYSFRPGKGVYEIQNKDLEKANGDMESWSTDAESSTDSGLGLDEERKGKGNEKI